MKEIKDRVVRTERINWKELNPFQPDNLKVMTAASFEILKNSITSKNFVASFSVWEEQTEHGSKYWILDGHHRLHALKALEQEGWNIPEKFNCEIIDCANAKEANELLLTFSSSHATFDDLGLAEFIQLNQLDFDELKKTLEISGVDFDQMQNDLTEQCEPQSDEDEIPELAIEPISKIGDVWLLDRHRLICGDSTQINFIDILMAGEKADLVFTDPPYGMSYGGGRARGDHVKDKETGGVKIKAHGIILGDEKGGEELIDLVRDAISNAVMSKKPTAATYVCFTWRTWKEFERALNESDLTPSACIVWNKKSIGVGNSHYRPQHEFIFYCKGEKWYGEKDQSDIWSLSRGNTGEYVHPTQKPVELIEKAILHNTSAGDIVIDVFGGSGSTLIACEKTNRKARLCELDPKYIDTIVKRWQKYSGKKAIHEATKQTFDELSPLV